MNKKLLLKAIKLVSVTLLLTGVFIFCIAMFPQLVVAVLGVLGVVIATGILYCSMEEEKN